MKKKKYSTRQRIKRTARFSGVFKMLNKNDWNIKNGQTWPFSGYLDVIR
jgi:hypothetical protein